MEFIPVPNCVQVDIVCDFQGQICQNVLHYVKAAPWEQTSMAELGEGIQDILFSQFAPVVSNALTYTGLRITDLSASNAPVIEYSAGFPIAGAASSPPLPNNVTCVFTKRTLLRGRSYRGRIYHLGLTEALVTGNTVDPAFVAPQINRYNMLRGIDLPLTADEAIMVVVSRFNAGVPRITGVATPVTNFTSDGVVDSQRRRLPRRGK